LLKALLLKSKINNLWQKVFKNHIQQLFSFFKVAKKIIDFLKSVFDQEKSSIKIGKKNVLFLKTLLPIRKTEFGQLPN